jgi:UDP-N-acetylglucosamine--N-acetylmuramyl-(pentapeptide) pyrophosphoryl-undecaprenol N-acetylglucosamine transferase
MMKRKQSNDKLKADEMTAEDKKTIFLAAGGTGGHLFPAIALAEELARQGYQSHLVMDKRGHVFKQSDVTIPYSQINAATFKGGVWGKLKSAFTLAVGMVEAFILLVKHRPVAVVGFGGYPSVPTMVMARVLGIPTVLHEQNAVLGKANTFLARTVKTLALSFAVTKGTERFEKKAVVTGNPVRQAVVKAAQTAYQAPSENSEIVIFILGGSQGAQSLSALLPRAFALMPAEVKSRLHIMQQARAEDVMMVETIYKDAGIKAEIAPFFKDVAARYQKTQLFIGRSGASTVTEIAVMGLPAVFVPMMHQDRQQFLNADVLAKDGGALVIDQAEVTPEVLAPMLEELLRDPPRLMAMAGVSKSKGQPAAVSHLAAAVMKTVKG